MSLVVYMDENVHGAITNGLRQRQVDVLTVQEDHRSGIADPEVLDRATELQRVLFSQDDDLLAEAKHRQMLAVPFPGVVFARQSKVSSGGHSVESSSGRWRSTIVPHFTSMDHTP